MLMPLVLLTSTMALASLGLISEEAGGVLAMTGIVGVALLVVRFRQSFGHVVPAASPESPHIVRDTFVGLAALALAVGVPLFIWVNVAGLGLMDLSYLTGAAGLIIAGAAIGRRRPWAGPAVAWAVTMATVLAGASRSLTLSLYLIVALTALTVVAVEYRSFSRRFTNGG